MTFRPDAKGGGVPERWIASGDVRDTGCHDLLRSTREAR